MIKTGLKAKWGSAIMKPVMTFQLSVFFLFLYTCANTELLNAARPVINNTRQNQSARQLLLNGRIWRNQYSKAFGDPFFLSNTFMKGTVTYNGVQFENQDLLFDITNDELILSTKGHPTIMINKEMVDSFSLRFENTVYHVFNSGTDASEVLRGYVNILYNGPSALYVKYIKKIQPLAVDGRYDLFYQEHHIYLRKGSQVVPVQGKRKLLKELDNRKKEIRNYIKSMKLKINRKDPDSFIPVLRYYDSLED